MEKLRIIVGGFIGLYPSGGVTWDYIQYVLGLKALGHDVYYIEDTAQFPKYQKNGRRWDDATDSIQYLEKVMNDFDLRNHWCYIDVASGNYYGLNKREHESICRSADIFLNISASSVMRDEYLTVPHRVLIDTDPMFTQVQYESATKEYHGQNKLKMDYLVNQHNCFFSFAEGIRSGLSKVPVGVINWQTTRQPIILSYWKNSKKTDSSLFTTVMNWSVTKPLEYAGETWGQKDVEFLKFAKLPLFAESIKFKIIASRVPEHELKILNGYGWQIETPFGLIDQPEQYLEFIQASYGEFSVAKETYVKSKGAWFSCRSACYLAAGKPVITQETGWSSYIPSGRGLFAFTDIQSAKEALEAVSRDYNYHSKWALNIANEYFDSDKVLTELLAKIDRTN